MYFIDFWINQANLNLIVIYYGVIWNSLFSLNMTIYEGAQ